MVQPHHVPIMALCDLALDLGLPNLRFSWLFQTAAASAIAVNLSQFEMWLRTCEALGQTY